MPFVIVQTVAVVAFMSFANWQDTGRWSMDGWQAMAAGGLVCGSVLFQAQSRRYRAPEVLHSHWLRSLLRLSVLSVCCIACSFAVGLFLLMISTGGNWVVLGLLVVPLTTLLLVPMMIPFGVLCGIVDHLILSLGRADSAAAGT